MAVTEELVAWLREQVDEDERVAKAAEDRGHRQWKVEANYDGGYVLDGHGEIVVYDEGRPWTAEATHIARHDPARVLAEVAAKRRIIDLHRQVPGTPRRGQENPPATGCEWCNEWDGLTWAGGVCDTVRLLASVYAGRPGWQSEWAPDEEDNRG